MFMDLNSCDIFLWKYIKIIVMLEIQKTMTNLTVIRKVVRNIRQQMLRKVLWIFVKELSSANSNGVRFKNMFTC